MAMWKENCVTYLFCIVGLCARCGRCAETTGAARTALYPVEVNFHIEEMDTSKGITMHFDKGAHKMRLDASISKAEGLAWGRFDDNIDTTGWSELYLEASPRPAVPNDPKMYAAGYIEGLMTCVRISQHFANSYQLLTRKKESVATVAAIRDLFEKEIRFLQSKAQLQANAMAESPADPYWKHVRYVFLQLWGVADGYNFAAAHFNVRKLSLEDMLMLNSGNELQVLMQAFSGGAVVDRMSSQRHMSFLQRGVSESAGGGRRGGSPSHAGKRAAEQGLGLSEEDWKKRLAQVGHCSALVRLTETDILLGHTTWGDYSTMLRIFKYYKLPLEGAGTMASQIAFSSYPGVISSLDSFYTMDTGLVVMDTSLPILDSSRWADIMDFPANPHIPNFAHIMASNRLARSAAHWAELITSMNAGTYNAQWMVVDYNLFMPGSTHLESVLWVAEMVPGKAQAADMTGYLQEHGFWASANRPYFEDVREVAGYTSAEKFSASLYSWSQNQRAQALAGSAPGVGGYKAMRELMSRNLNPDGSAFEISARLDLDSVHLPNGGIDAKITGRCLASSLEVQAISSPSHHSLPPFKWNDGAQDLWPGWPHYGLPNIWNFDFVEMSPAGLVELRDPTLC